jgi:hypothetical protein
MRVIRIPRLHIQVPSQRDTNVLRSGSRVDNHHCDAPVCVDESTRFEIAAAARTNPHGAWSDDVELREGLETFRNGV